MGGVPSWVLLVADKSSNVILCIPELPEEDITIMQGLISTLELMSKLIDKKHQYASMVTEKNSVAYLKIDDLSFAFIAPANIKEDVLRETIVGIVEEFRKTFGTSPDGVRSKIVARKDLVDDFLQRITKIFLSKISVYAPMSLDLILGDLFYAIRNLGMDPGKLGIEIIPVNIPILKDKDVLKKIKDKKVRKILELCDGTRTIEDIAKSVDSSKVDILKILVEYNKRKIISWEVRYRVKV